MVSEILSDILEELNYKVVGDDKRIKLKLSRNVLFPVQKTNCYAFPYKYTEKINNI